MATMLVLGSIWKLLLPEFFPADETKLETIPVLLLNRMEQLKVSGQLQDTVKSALRDAIEQAMEFIVNIDEQFPMVYSTLELGSSWQAIGLKMLGLYLEDVEEKKYSENLGDFWGQMDSPISVSYRL